MSWKLLETTEKYQIANVILKKILQARRSEKDEDDCQKVLCPLRNNNKNMVRAFTSRYMTTKTNLPGKLLNYTDYDYLKSAFSVNS